MAQPDAGNRIAAGALTTLGLSVVWLAIVTNLPSQSELSASAVTTEGTGRVAVGAPSASVISKSITPPSPVPSSEPEIDLSIPGVPSGAPPASAVALPPVGEAAPTQADPRMAQVSKLKCDAEIEQLCPDMGDGPARARCLEKRSRNLTPVCRAQMQEQFVRWKEDRSRLLSACQDDARKLCAGLRPGDGRMMQCLQDHTQEVSDRCYQTLPKGKLLYRQ
jgi:hypothetical protein